MKPALALLVIGVFIAALLGVVIFYLARIDAAVEAIRSCTGPGFKSFGCP
jgi:hypothetical protein